MPKMPGIFVPGQRVLVKTTDGRITSVTPIEKEPAMPRKSRSRTKKVSYVLQVTCDKTPDMNETEFLQLVRQRLNGPSNLPSIVLNGGPPRVSVLKRVEEYIAPGKGEGHGD